MAICITTVTQCHNIVRSVTMSLSVVAPIYGITLQTERLCRKILLYRPFYVGVASRLATDIYVAMVTPILYDNSHSLNYSNLKYESYPPYG